MSATDNGGPALPSIDANYSGLGGVGMTLRDYFAAMAMQAFLRNRKPHLTDARSDEWALAAYEMADAMLRARKDV